MIDYVGITKCNVVLHIIGDSNFILTVVDLEDDARGQEGPSRRDWKDARTSHDGALGSLKLIQIVSMEKQSSSILCNRLNAGYGLVVLFGTGDGCSGLNQTAGPARANHIRQQTTSAPVPSASS